MTPPMTLLDLKDAIAKAIADAIGHGMREKCERHADAVLAVVCPQLLATAEHVERIEADTLRQPADSGQPFAPDWAGYRQGVEDGRAEAPAAQGQGEVAGSGPCNSVSDAVQLAEKSRWPDDEGFVWVPERCYSTMVGEVARLEAILYTDGEGNITAPPASPVGAPDAITDLNECRKVGWNDSAPAYRAGWNACRAAMLAAAPSAPEGDGGAE